MVCHLLVLFRGDLAQLIPIVMSGLFHSVEVLEVRVFKPVNKQKAHPEIIRLQHSLEARCATFKPVIELHQVSHRPEIVKRLTSFLCSLLRTLLRSQFPPIFVLKIGETRATYKNVPNEIA